jgi:hypothetical protein
MGFHRIAFGGRIKRAGVIGRIEHSDRVPLGGLARCLVFRGALASPVN